MRYLLLRLKRFCGFITGFVFFFGGILKLLDPVGAGLVMKEYLEFLHMGFLAPVSKAAGVTFAFAETAIGAALITGVWRRPFAVAAMLLQGFFTLLTLLFVIFKPEMDCGCFGEAIHLTHWQTFIKNLVLCVLLAAYYFPPKQLGHNKKRKFVSFAIVCLSTLMFMTYSLLYIPMVDFTDFKPAAALQAGHAFATYDGDIYESVFIYGKDGEEEAFDMENLPDTSWTFVRTETRLKEGYDAAAMPSLSFFDREGTYQDALAAEGDVLVMSIYDMDVKARFWSAAARFISDAESTGFRPLILAAASPEQTDKALSGLDKGTAEIIRRHLYHSDYKTLISMNRSNGGVTYFCDGYLIRKWAGRDIPDMAEMKSIYDDDTTEAIIAQDTKGSLGFQGFLLYVSAVMLLL